jgi:simple sugar transport system substrate-binding protein
VTGAPRLVAVLLAAGLALLATGCDSGRKSRSSASRVTVTAPAAPVPGARQQPLRQVRIVVVTHGQASDPFWAIVKKGIEQAARDLGVSVSYEAPDTYTAARMATLIDAAVSTRPNGLVVSIPDAPVLAPEIAQARAAGIPVVAINSGEEVYRRLGALLYVGQPEYAAGLGAGRRMAAAGVRNAICVNHQVGVASLDARCRGFAAAMARAGGRTRVIRVGLQAQAEAERRIAAAASSAGVDGVLALGPGGATPALRALATNHLLGRVKLATFDLAPDILRAIKTRRILFAVDQQPYLQGYLPIVFLTQRRLYGLFPARGTVIATGPTFVTRANVARVQELIEAGVR